MKTTRLVCWCLTLLLGVGGPGMLWAPPARGEYPSRPIELVVSFPAGGSTDIICRALSDVAPKYLGQPLVVVNRAGAGGSLATAQVAQAKPDGHTLLCAIIGPNVLQPHMRKLPYGVDSFIPIVHISSRTIALGVKADAPWKSLKDLVEDARKNPGKIRYGVSQGALPHLMVLNLVKRAGIQLTHVPYQGDAPGITALLGGHIELVSASSISALVPHLKAGTVRVLGIFEAQRLKEFPDIPTAKEAGFDVTGNAWTGVAAPKGTPDEVVQKLEDALLRTMSDPAFLDRMAKVGERVDAFGRKEFTEKWYREYERYGAIIRGAGLAQ